MIGSSENRISYNGNGIATEFAYTFKILEKSNLKVLHVAADGTEELLTTDYYVDMEKSVVLYPGYAPGAEIPEQNRPPILPVGERLVLYREVPITQESALDKHWPFNVIENGLDKLTIICQQIWDRLQRSFYVSESTSTNFDPKVPIEAGKTFRVKDDGTGFEVTEDPGKVIDGATALLKQTTEQAEFANEQAVNAQNAANTAEAVAPEYARTKEVLDNIVSYTNTATEQAGIATAMADTATQKADAASTSAANAAQSYINADAIATQLTEYLATKESLTAPAVDKTLLIEGAAADAKVVGELKSDLGIVIDTNVDYIEQPLTIEKKRYYGEVGTVVLSVDESRMAAKVIVSEGETYRLSTYIGSSKILSGIIYLDSANVILAKDLTGINDYVTDYEFTIPSNCASIIVQNARYNSTSFIYLKKLTETKTAKSYTKAESDGRYQPGLVKKYGIKWEIGNSDDLGQRCFDAVGLTASIGVGATDGVSDFDSIYPWSDIKRCNIKQNDNGAYIVTFEGEDGFALDGTNGDVFVRIPKFYYEHYKKDGYEYHIVSSTGRNPHPCFIEDGKELDEIFVGAFEGYVNDGKLTSVADVIPTSNITPVEFLSAAKANGANYTLYDMRTVSAIWVLMAVEYGRRNSNRILGYGASDYYQPVEYGRSKAVISSQGANSITTEYWTDEYKNYMPIGANITICGNNDQRNILTQAKLISVLDNSDKTQTTFTFDGPPIDVDTSCFIGSAALSTNFTERCSSPLSWHTGRADFVSGSRERNPIRYRWIENIFGNLWHYLPDVTFNNLQMYVCKSMKDYEMFSITGAYKPVSDLFPRQEENGSKADDIGVNFWVNEMSDDYFSNGVMFGKSFDMQLTSAKAFGAYYYLYRGRGMIANGGGFDHLYRSNVLTMRAWIKDSGKWYLYGARLLYKHIS